MTLRNGQNFTLRFLKTSFTVDSSYGIIKKKPEALGAAVLGGGLPAIGIATVCFGSKLYVQHRNKALEGAEAQSTEH